MRFLDNLIQIINANLLPSACICCQQFQTDVVCKQCLNSLTNNCLVHYECCLQCGSLLNAEEIGHRRCKHCKDCPPFFDQTICLDRYEGQLKEALHQLKYSKRIAYAHGLARAWNHVFSTGLESCHTDCLLPVPLSLQKLHARGFNQSWELAKRIDCDPRIQKLPYALKRHHHPEHQAGQAIAKRQDTIKGMFYIDARYIDYLTNKTVVIFDDVMTSGATLNEIARILKANGASRVMNWVLLRATRLS